MPTAGMLKRLLYRWRAFVWPLQCVECGAALCRVSSDGEIVSFDPPFNDFCKRHKDLA